MLDMTRSLIKWEIKHRSEDNSESSGFTIRWLVVPLTEVGNREGKADFGKPTKMSLVEDMWGLK